MITNLKQSLKKKKGFTLIELIIVIAIIAILGGLVIPKLMGTQDNAKKKADIANGKIIHDAVATLITEDKITLSKDEDGNYEETEFEVVKQTAKSTDTEKLQYQLTQYLQTIPEPKYEPSTSKHFYVTISTTKDITVEVKDGTTSVQVYPEPATPYK